MYIYIYMYMCRAFQVPGPSYIARFVCVAVCAPHSAKGLVQFLQECRFQSSTPPTAPAARGPLAQVIAPSLAVQVHSLAGLWSKVHIKLCQDWHAHLLRERNSRSFAAMLVKFQDASFLGTMRLLVARGGAPRGTGTRSAPGWPQARWEEQVIQASRR